MRDENMYYSSVREVLNFSNLDRDDFKAFADDSISDADFDNYVTSLLLQTKDLIDRYTRTNFSNTYVFEGIHPIATRIVANMLLQSKQRAEGGFVQIYDGTQAKIDDTVLTTSVRRDLDMYKRKTPGGIRATRPVSIERNVLGSRGRWYV